MILLAPRFSGEHWCRGPPRCIIQSFSYVIKIKTSTSKQIPSSSFRLSVKEVKLLHLPVPLPEFFQHIQENPPGLSWHQRQ